MTTGTAFADTSITRVASGALRSSVLLVVPTLAERGAVLAGFRRRTTSDPVRIVVCGMGRACVIGLCDRLDASSAPVEAVALLGWAGGLVPSLRPGDVVVADAALEERGGRAPCTAVPVPGATVGPILTVAAPLLTAADKASQRGSGALAVDMEAYPLAAWAEARGVPFIHARVILDAVDESLPDIGEALDPFGRVRPAALVRRLALHPSSAVALASLARRTHALGPALGVLAREIVGLLAARGGD